MQNAINNARYGRMTRSVLQVRSKVNAHLTH
jgi:hypothetical protein